jgi:RND family efflux transporter MFP subunit
MAAAPRPMEILMLDSSSQRLRQAARKVMKRRSWVIIAIVLAIAVTGIGARLIGRAILGRETTASAIPTVFTIKPEMGAAGDDLVLPGNVQAYNQASIFARVSGYLKSWQTDIGTKVKQGDVLAEIDAPEVDQQLRQAEADLATAEANYRLAQTTNKRWVNLLKSDSVSKQDADEKAGDAAAKKALVDSASANVARLQDLEGFKRVIAPFDGVVTARNTDIGNLINAGSSELFRVADTSKLRVYVQVPQAYAATTAAGIKAELRFAEHPGQGYGAEIIRTANALDPASRTLQVELQVDNNTGALFPGSYAEVHFKLPGNAGSMKLPAAAFLFRTEGLEVAVVDADQRVVLKPVVTGRDFGSALEVLSGLSANDNVIINPSDSITAGAQVRVAAAPPGAAEPEKAPQKGGKSS